MKGDRLDWSSKWTLYFVKDLQAAFRAVVKYLVFIEAKNRPLGQKSEADVENILDGYEAPTMVEEYNNISTNSVYG